MRSMASCAGPRRADRCRRATAHAAPRTAALPRPDQVAHPPLRQIQLGDSESVLGRREGVEPVRRCPLRHEDAEALLGAPADPAAQLVQLRQPEALGVLDEHDGGVGDVDADFDDRRRDQNLDLARPEPAHDLVALLGLEPPMHQPHAELGPACREALRHRRGRAEVGALRLLDDREHHVGRRPLAHSSRTNSSTRSRCAPVRTAVRIVPRPGGRWCSVDTSRSPYSVRASERGIGVAVSSSTSGAAPLPISAARCSTPKRCCSSITDEAQPLERDALLHERVRAHDQAGLAGGEPRTDGLLLRRRSAGRAATPA